MGRYDDFKVYVKSTTLWAFYDKINGLIDALGSLTISWNDIVDKPNFADPSWKGAVAAKSNLPLTGNSIGDMRIVVNDVGAGGGIYECIATYGTLDQQWDKMADVNWGLVTWAAIQGKPDTLAGFGITDAAPGGFGLGTFAVNKTLADQTTKLGTGVFYAATNDPDLPVAGKDGHYIEMRYDNANFAQQMFFVYGGAADFGFYFRKKTSGTWGAWKQLITPDAITNMVVGNIAGIRITIGTAAPSSPVAGKEIWLDTTAGAEAIKWYNASAAWIIFGAALK